MSEVVVMVVVSDPKESMESCLEGRALPTPKIVASEALKS